MTDYEPLDGECIDGDGDPWPEHDYRGNECRRCGAEASEVDERDYCPACTGTVHTCVCSDLVTSHPSQL